MMNNQPNERNPYSQRSCPTRNFPLSAPVFLKGLGMLLLFMMAGIPDSHAQDFLWAKSMGGTSFDRGRSIAVDGSGNVYTTGFFQVTADFDPGAGTANLTSAGSADIFVSRLGQGLACPANNVLYVNASATGANNGTSWTDAFTDLQDALSSTCTGITQIWVAAGTYYPDQGGGQTNDDRNATFLLKNDVAIHGGFPGGETMLAERNWTTNVTILSGDINGSGNLTGNSYSVVTDSGTNATAEMDGFTITGEMRMVHR